MRPYTLFAVFLLTSSNLLAQPYATFHKNRPAYYQFNSNDVFYQQAAIAIESIQVNGSDTTFFHSTIIDYDNANGCYIKEQDTSFAGILSVRNSTGDDFFFNRNHDDIYFTTSASVNQSWEMYHFTNGDVITATIQSIDQVSILGVNDSVKTIKLQAQNSSGNNISNIFNGKIFKVGKATGFVSGFSLFHFPIDTIKFSIVGIENPPQGLNTSGLSPQEIFDFEVGDRFDYIGGGVSEPSLHDKDYRMDSILSKWEYYDEISYTIYRKEFHSHQNFSDYWQSYDEGIVQLNYNLSEFTYFNSLPSQWSEFDSDYSGGPSQLMPSIYSPGATVKDFFINYFNFNDTCLTEIIWGVGPGNIRYAQGLGKTYSYFGYPAWCNFDTLTYYRKNGIEWGLPINWAGLTGINPNPGENSLQIYPNPSRDCVLLSGILTSHKTVIHLLNVLGEEVMHMTLSSSPQPARLDISYLPNGLYLLKIQSGEKVYSQNIIKE